MHGLMHGFCDIVRHMFITQNHHAENTYVCIANNHHHKLHPTLIITTSSHSKSEDRVILTWFQITCRFDLFRYIFFAMYLHIYRYI
jgi:hypothetical protein